MSEADQQIDELERRLDTLVRTQIDFQKEISLIRNQIRQVRASSGAAAPDQSFYEPPSSVVDPPKVGSRKEESESPKPPIRETPKYSETNYRTSYSRAEETSPGRQEFVTEFFAKNTESARADLEKFIGENLISKIGILILITGVAIGVKYSIDNNLISPLTRVILGYAFGFGLVGLSLKLKQRYLNFSAVLVSGGMAIMYFVTYFGYSVYLLIGQGSAFVLMVMFTVFTVGAALFYNRQVIAHIGLVGAYAVPFLLSNVTGNYLFLFVYMSIINAGILAVSIKRSWKPLFYTSFGFTWVIFASWFASRYSVEHFNLALVFLAIFFGVFLATKILQGVIRGESSHTETVVGTIPNGIVFYSFCLAISVDRLSNLQITTLFVYLAAITAGVLLLSFRYVGKPLVYLASAAVWMIYSTWFATRYDPGSQMVLAATFAALFFAVIYSTTLAYRIIHEDFTAFEYTGSILTNSFLFYGFGYSILDGHELYRNFLGLYTASHSTMHLAVAVFVSRLKASAVDVVQVLAVLVLTFASLSIPVQFDGNVVTMIWASEAALLFWFGRTHAVQLFEYFSYPIMVLATGSLFFDWIMSLTNRTAIVSEFNLIPFRNGDFITSIVFLGAFALIFITNRYEGSEPAVDKELIKPIGYAIAAVSLFVLYNMFRIEIDNYFHLRLVDLRSVAESEPSRALNDAMSMNVISQIDYTMFFATVLAAVNLWKIRSKTLAVANIAIGILSLAVLSTLGMILFDGLRTSYALSPPFANQDPMNIAIRYISYAFAAGLIYALYKYSQDPITTGLAPETTRTYAFEGVAYVFVFIAGSCELVNLMAQFQIGDATKLGLSILWGVYALALIIIGIARDKKHLRIAAIVLLGVTLAKLFFYDISNLETIPKTILFVTLGITLLVISFLYNKYKAVIFRTREG
jgi:hypothetical protein